MQVEDNQIRRPLNFRQQRPKTAILMKQFRVAGYRPKTPLICCQISRADCTCCNQLVYSNSIMCLDDAQLKQDAQKSSYYQTGKKLSAQKEDLKRVIRSGSKNRLHRELMSQQGKRLDPYEFINQKYEEIMQEYEEEKKTPEQDNKLQAFLEFDLLKDQTNFPNTFQLTQNQEYNKSRPQSQRNNKNEFYYQFANQNKKQKQNQQEMSSVIISKVVDVKKLEDNMYYSPRDKAIKQILSNAKSKQGIQETQEVFSYYANNYFLINQKIEKNRPQPKNQEASSSSIQKLNTQNDSQLNQLPILMELENQDYDQTKKKQTILGSLINKNKTQQITQEPRVENPQKVFSLIPNLSPKSSFQNQENAYEKRANIKQKQPNYFMQHMKQIKRDQNMDTKKQVNSIQRKNSISTPQKQQSISHRSQQQLSTTNKETSRGNILLTTNETLKTEEDYLTTPSKQNKRQYLNDFIRSPYSTEFPLKAVDNNLMFNQHSPSIDYLQQSYLKKAISSYRDFNSQKTWRISTQYDEQNERANPQMIQQQQLKQQQEIVKWNRMLKKVSVNGLMQSSNLLKKGNQQSNQGSLTSREQKRVSFK
ncbi:hypothetical protein TTHERM_00289340 (macronuclear) [Tetrahymena thermophila SB210]|uniref:Uncharacterized protein n=1 Tax=Tetrahymena thermophila (strain SB210) TaxID=312017 RepID=I7MKG9_TETTS|nr:hypothetical protein TTHERM_00289340 [Tetrahymena thermophila SB210]EAR98406.2 hypothetical protein TTHERM_00289340 [Tetrahymena thermophila SB210]|eukprot:XP_001018651.2 hypothetical protein TTHERM_00289340 [Tetrahymena thermophila SB210]